MNTVPGSGTVERPKISTGVDGPRLGDDAGR